MMLNEADGSMILIIANKIFEMKIFFSLLLLFLVFSGDCQNIQPRMELKDTITNETLLQRFICNGFEPIRINQNNSFEDSSLMFEHYNLKLKDTSNQYYLW
jgi:hypothetical protein